MCSFLASKENRRENRDEEKPHILCLRKRWFIETLTFCPGTIDRILVAAPGWNLIPLQEEQNTNQEWHQIMEKGRGITGEAQQSQSGQAVDDGEPAHPMRQH